MWTVTSIVLNNIQRNAERLEHGTSIVYLMVLIINHLYTMFIAAIFPGSFQHTLLIESGPEAAHKLAFIIPLHALAMHLELLTSGLQLGVELSEGGMAPSLSPAACHSFSLTQLLTTSSPVPTLQHT